MRLPQADPPGTGRARVGVVFQTNSLDDQLTGWENIGVISKAGFK